MDRYEKFGGLARALSLYESGAISFSGIGAAVGFTGETVRKDVIKLLGESRYCALVNARKIARMNKSKLLASGTLGGQEALEVLSGMPESPDWDLPTRVLNAVVAEANRRGKAISNVVVSAGRLRSFAADGRLVGVRTALPLPHTRTGAMGLVRLKAGVVHEGHDLVLVSILGDDVVSYLLPPRVVRSVQTLCLRYDRFERESRYAEFRDAWHLVFGNSTAERVAG